MAWTEVLVMEERSSFVLLAEKHQQSFSSLCTEYGISRKTGYKWVERYHKYGLKALTEFSRRPMSCPQPRGQPRGQNAFSSQPNRVVRGRRPRLQSEKELVSRARAVHHERKARLLGADAVEAGGLRYIYGYGVDRRRGNNVGTGGRLRRLIRRSGRRPSLSFAQGFNQPASAL